MWGGIFGLLEFKQDEDCKMKGNYTRRDFLAAAAAAGATAILPKTGLAGASAMTIQDVIDIIVQAVPGAPWEKTRDTFKAGDPSVPVTGVASTFLATIDVIKKTAELGANLIITHEPTYFNDQDETEWLSNDEIYVEKRRLLKELGIAVWRFHDYWHLYEPDGMLAGLLKKLEWEKYPVSDRDNFPSIVRLLPPRTLAEVANHFKERLGIDRPVQIIGNPEMTVRTVGLLPGAFGGTMHINFLGRAWSDVLVVGEINEWETAIYVQDAISTGKETSLLILGHAVSEEPGMELLVDWLQPKIPDIPVHHVPTKDPFVLI